MFLITEYLEPKVIKLGPLRHQMRYWKYVYYEHLKVHGELNKGSYIETFSLN